MNSKLQILPFKAKVTLNREGIIYHQVSVKGDQGVYRAWDFTPEKVYETIGITHKVYEDGSVCLVYLLINDEGTLVEKAVDNFLVLEKPKEEAI